MKRVKLFEQFISEEFIVDKISQQPLFDQNEKMSPNDFLKRIKKSPEAQEALKNNLNFGKGIEAVKFLSKKLPIKLDVTVYRSAWNYGGNLVVQIRIAGMDSTYSGAPFLYSSGNSTTSPSYSMGRHFEGIPHPGSNIGKLIQSGVLYGSYESSSNHQGVLEDIVAIFKAYEAKHGIPFSVKNAIKVQMRKDKVNNQFNALKEKLKRDYYTMKEIAGKLGISTREPQLVLKHNEIRMMIDEPRRYRHPDEYDSDATTSKEYSQFERLQSKIIDKLEQFARKNGLELSVAASWSY